ncbi:MAG: dTDP-glucose 4,6-dehydratase [Balneolaceae bacterium]
MKKVLVTGGSGFIGSNLILYLHEELPGVEILNMDKLTYAADNNHLQTLKHSNRYRFSRVDLADRPAVRDMLRRWMPDTVIHLAAESHVDNSIRGPEPFVQSNLVGTFNLIEECRQLWNDPELELEPGRFLHVSTDEVFGSLGEEGTFNEQSPYAPNSPYSATKAGSDLLVRSYHRTYGMDVVITNCSNNFGPHQHDEKLIPTVIRQALRHKPIPIYGNGKQVRDWLHVSDHCRALHLLVEQGESGEQYTIGGDNEWENIKLVEKICDLLNKRVGEGPGGDYKRMISFTSDRPGHDLRYAVDSRKLMDRTGWTPSEPFEELLAQTVDWFAEKYMNEKK